MSDSVSWQDVPEDSNIAEYRDTTTEYFQGIREVEALGLVDIGSLGSWSVSSYKPGSGIKELREDSPSSYWQSDGTQPHSLDIHFSKRVTVARLSFFTDYVLDESYTPSKIVIYAGSGFHDLVEVVTLDLEQPTGWTHVVFSDIEDSKEGLRTFLIRVHVVANHQHGKDTHLRAVKVYSTQSPFTLDTSLLGQFTSRKLLSESTIR